MCKPFLKWVGGKTQLLPHISPLIPKTILNYYEPFLGGGSVLLYLLSAIDRGEITLTGKIFASDINESLIWCYKNIQRHPQAVWEELNRLITEFQNCGDETVNRNPTNLTEALENRENYYYYKRKEYNSLSDYTLPSTSALFIWLNKTCFRGVHRVGPNGFNVPYGHYKNPEIATRDNIFKVSHLISRVEFLVNDYKTVLSTEFNSDDFVYLDPPYISADESGFVGYTKSGFGGDEHKCLFDMVKSLRCRFLMSNADVSVLRTTFSDYNIIGIESRRSINSKRPQSTASEVLITNLID
jgi:DNA adenine methylase